MPKAPKVRNRIGRYIYETHCIGSRYDPIARKSIPFNETINGNVVRIDRVKAVLAKRFGKDVQFIIEELHHSKTYVSAPLDKFLAIVDEKNTKEID